MIIVRLLLLCLLAPKTALSQVAQNVFSIYTLPPFALTMKSSWIITDADLPSTAADVQSITQTYLHDYFRASLLNSQISSLNELHSVELQVSLRMLDSSRLWAEIYGNVAFVEPEDDTGNPVPTPKEVHDLLDSWIAKAFDASSALPLYQQRLIVRSDENLVLQNLQQIAVDLDVEAGPPPPIAVTSGGAPETDNSWTTTEFILLATLLLFLATSGAALFIFLKAEKYRYRRDAEFESLQYEREQKERDGSMRDVYISHSHSSWDHNLNEGLPEDSRDLVPIMEPNGSRRYVAPTTPNQVLYGASHLHADRRVVERQQQQNKFVGTPRYTTTSNINPMTPIAEDHSAAPSYSSTPGSPMVSWFRSMGMMGALFSSPKAEEIKNQDAPFVYRDFPRHDGTPCLMYNPSEDSTHDDDALTSSHHGQLQAHAPEFHRQQPPNHSNHSAGHAQQPVASQSYSIDMGDATLQNSHHGMPSASLHSARSISSTNSLEVFIDRLERLYQMKRRRYDERKEMDDMRRKSRARASRRQMGSSAASRGATSSVEMAPIISRPMLDATPRTTNASVSQEGVSFNRSSPTSQLESSLVSEHVNSPAAATPIARSPSTTSASLDSLETETLSSLGPSINSPDFSWITTSAEEEASTEPSTASSMLDDIAVKRSDPPATMHSQPQASPSLEGSHLGVQQQYPNRDNALPPTPNPNRGHPQGTVISPCDPLEGSTTMSMSSISTYAFDKGSASSSHVPEERTPSISSVSTPPYMPPKVSAGEGLQQKQQNGNEHMLGTMPYSSDQAVSATMVVTPEKSDDASSTTGAIGS
jgi:hypothetical protein